ncbi:MAG: class I SAM-dependent methyltransferase [Ktedonobacterales bacterium]
MPFEPSDEVAQYNMARWHALAQANALFTRPYLDLDTTAARERLDPDGRLGDVTGKRVLCVAGGGGRQSAAFALLGANVTVFDLSSDQLQRDQAAAAHYNLTIKIEQGDMRDLTRFAPASFDIVWQPYSLNFVPDARGMFREVAQVIRPGGLYSVMCANPFTCGITSQDWAGDGYPIRTPYRDDAEITSADEAWVFATDATETEDAPAAPVFPPREYRHTLGTLISGLADSGFVLWRLDEHTHQTPGATPASWEHFTSFAPPWFTLWVVQRPELPPPPAQRTYEMEA